MMSSEYAIAVLVVLGLLCVLVYALRGNQPQKAHPYSQEDCPNRGKEPGDMLNPTYWSRRVGLDNENLYVACSLCGYSQHLLDAGWYENPIVDLAYIFEEEERPVLSAPHP